MDTPGSESTADSTDVLTDSSSEGSHSAQIMTSPNDNQVSSNLNLTSITDDDSASDVSMSAETDDGEDETLQSSAIHVNPDMHMTGRPVPVEETEKSTFNKRKISEPIEAAPSGHISNGEAQGKRPKPDVYIEKYRTPEGRLHQDKSNLPAEIWHHIFTFIPPRTLGLLLRVNKTFNLYIDPSSFDHSIRSLTGSTALMLQPDQIWRASRRLFRPNMPAPLQGKTELDMWKLGCAFSCQFCAKKQSLQNISSDKWHPGPGENGVIPIWSFAVSTCGPCLQIRSSKVAKSCSFQSCSFTN